jgi:hypothetical protein
LEADPGDDDPRISRLLDAVRHLERIASPEAVDALTRASEALDCAVLNLRDRSPQRRAPSDDVRGESKFSGMPFVRDVEYADGKLRGSVTFPDVWPDGSSWVDAGTVSLVLQEFLGELATRQVACPRPASLSVEFLSVTPRNRALSLMARSEAIDGNGIDVHASLADAEQVIAVVRGRFLQS